MAGKSDENDESRTDETRDAATGDDESRARRVRRQLRVDPDRFDLGAIDPSSTPGLPSRSPGDVDPRTWSRDEVARIGGVITQHQERLFAAAATGVARWRVLLVLQAMDGGGKDGTVKSVVGAINPLGVRITAFSAPSEEELARHFLWRIDRALPPVGVIGVFNRSHYEDVLVARVRELVPKPVWQRRYQEINEFERMQADDGMTIIKVMLHISAEEQRQRLLARLDNPAKRWKFRAGDLVDRAHWAEYQKAYRDALIRCSAPAAPWYVVPADRKWYRNWAVANIMLAHLAEVRTGYPEPEFDVEQQRSLLAAAEVTG